MMQNIRLAAITALIYSGLAIGCSSAMADIGYIPDDKWLYIFRRSCFAYGIQKYDLADIKEVVKLEIADAYVWTEEDKEALVNPSTESYQNNLVGVIVRHIAISCPPGSQLPKIYQQQYFSHLIYRDKN